MRNSSTPLTPSQQAALECITQDLDEDEMITHDAAVNLLTAGGFERPEAEDLLEQLLLKGYVYESTNGLRLTP
ncbi:hypothetical protein SAMN04487950_3892 [Halogranum rubrum]|uniref:Uncharacterized protein n=1 Tax=Halogranum rubrum TaxID=553466 RepID=A0A1I4HWT4_9EURY|nr:hypothetical protein [Halogranum rubrum]SFL46524.1 hypothetical protein SAMN04487950_3892 [Halogranum rubrum]